MSVRGLYFLLPALLLPTIYALTACGVDFTPPYFEVNSLSGATLLLVDSNGNLLIPSSTINFNATVPTSLTDALILWSLGLGRPVMAFTQNEADLEGSIYENQTSLPDQNALLIYILGDLVASFTSSGDIYVKGTAVYSGAQAGCPADTTTCDVSTGDIYTYDYYCDTNTLTCTYNKILEEDCNTVTDSDEGNNPFIRGTCTVKGACSSGDTNCPIVEQNTDYCIDEYTLREFYISGNTCVYNDIYCYTLLDCQSGYAPGCFDGKCTCVIYRGV